MANSGDENNGDWMGATAMASPALLGAAAGLILAEVMHDNARRGVAIGLAALGVATLMPLAVGGVVRKVNGPDTRRGIQRRIRGIRDAGDGVDQELIEQGVL